jgi:hypothetical protein
MKSRLASLLTVVSVLLTGLVVTLIVVGPAWAAGLAVVSVLALAAWRGLTWGVSAGHDGVVAPYVLIVVLDVVLSTCRYLSGYPALLAEGWSPLFAAGFAITDPHWFVVFVVCPVSLMLVGGYFLGKRTPLGLYMAWWTALFGIADGLLQVRLESLSGVAYRHLYFVGAVVASGQMLVGAILCQRLLRLSGSTHAAASPRAGLTPRQRNLWSLLFVSLVVVYGTTLFRQGGPLPVVPIVGSMIAGLIGWRKTTALRPADPAVAVPLFLLLLSLFYVHVGEEALTDFSRAIASISGTPWNDRDFTLLIGLIGPAVWFFSAWSLWQRQPFGNFVYWFLIVGMILGEPAHLVVFPVMAMKKFGIGYQYFSGMYTALFPMIPAILALVAIVGEHRGRAARATA